MSTLASFPLDEFSLPTGGVILKSSDGVEFKVYKNILSLASPFFCQTFTLPQSVDSGDSETQTTGAGKKHDVQIISVSESSSALDIFLRLIRPIASPVLPGMSETGDVTDVQALVDAAEPVLAAAIKYEMHTVVKDLSTRLLDAAEMTLPDGNVVNDTLALRVYILACRYKLKEVARRAAHAALKGRVCGVFVEELRYINAAHYCRLIDFHTTVVITTRKLIKHDRIPRPYTKLSCKDCFISSRNYVTWNNFVKHALPILEESPRSVKVFSPAFGEETINLFNICSCDCLKAWNTTCRRIREEIEMAVTQNDIDLSEI